ncbi:dynein axonemal heavy chain 11-like [Cyprinus carpio]|uniref:Dynein axonemal heavy chain 11-like n=1 Tax=Cyprinus carpio TaxID=7962 RepID=A0A9Q9YWS6_CYPCA|nr:dynein axonemal heavy chain 11-like [Cyprinus carpio]
MFKSCKTKNIFAATNNPDVLLVLEDLQRRLAVCEKALVKYLETKRMAFPWFYFLSFADLLDILSKGRQPRQVTCHLGKLFDSMTDLKFSDKEGEKATVAEGMFSRDREFVPFYSQCDCVGPVKPTFKSNRHLIKSNSEVIKSGNPYLLSVKKALPKEAYAHCATSA